MKFVLFDTETTGFGDDDRIIQAGMMIVDQKGGVEVVEDLCVAHKPLPFDAMEVNNITPEMLEGKPQYAHTRFKKRLDELNSEDNYLIAHNIEFDMGMLQKEGFECRMKQIDTLRCARHLFPEQEKHRLQYLRYSLGLYRSEVEEAQKHNIEIKAHDAIGDVLTMKLLLRALMYKAKESYPQETDIMGKLCELSATPVLMETISFGKYKGESFESIAQRDRQYLQWLRNNTDEGKKDLIFTIDHHLGK